MKLLLDTHAFAWWLADDSKLPAAARSAIAQGRNDVWVNAVSVFEAATKYRLGKWPEADTLLTHLAEAWRQSLIRMLSLDVHHAALAGSIAGEHRDPFDRMIAAQSLVEDMTLVSGDPAFVGMGVPILWSRPLT
jgi:PIN domain nuclease of toxin-antitoxin system